tara:strand:- start:5045 stop:7171 length:2127 start_codon:yes stop_codon:yes gene_type:complete
MKPYELTNCAQGKGAVLCIAMAMTQFIPFNLAQAETTASIFEEVIVVTGTLGKTPDNLIQPATESLIAPDSAALVERLPGAALINNGTISGQVQYRGLFGSRVSTKINNQSFHSGGPNLMDPPMSYAPATLIESITVNRGISPVTFGPSLSGGVNADLKDINYAPTSDYASHYDLTAIGRSADESYAAGGIVGVSNENFKLSGLFSIEDGDDQRFHGGDIANTFHHRQVYGLTGGYKTDLSELTLSARRHETDPTGNAPFAMDIKLIDTNFFTANYLRSIGDVLLKLDFGYTDVYHEMNNYAFRGAPATIMRYRETQASANTNSAAVSLLFDVADASVEVGVDHNDADMDVTISNPRNTSFFINSLPNINVSRTGLYVNVQDVVTSWHYSLGARLDSHDSSSGDASYGSAFPGMAQNLANLYNATNRKWDDETVDLVAQFWKKQESLTWRFSLARKNRAPGFLERYAWLPTPASAGLADGNTYVGDRNIKPETLNVVEVGLDYEGDKAWIRPTLYFQQINNYIQGIPFDSTPGVIDHPAEMVSSANGDTTPLKFANVDARIYGFDTDYGYRLNEDWRVEGVVSTVRAERRDIDDNLYRVSPDKVSMSLVYDQTAWSATAETVLVSRQHHVSDTNSEAETGGYGLLNFYGTLRVNPRIAFSAGLENVLDKKYVSHLTGYNRVGNSDVPLGARIPGVGRNLHLQIHVSGI